MSSQTPEAVLDTTPLGVHSNPAMSEKLQQLVATWGTSDCNDMKLGSIWYRMQAPNLAHQLQVCFSLSFSSTGSSLAVIGLYCCHLFFVNVRVGHMLLVCEKHWHHWTTVCLHLMVNEINVDGHGLTMVDVSKFFGQETGYLTILRYYFPKCFNMFIVPWEDEKQSLAIYPVFWLFVGSPPKKIWVFRWLLQEVSDVYRAVGNHLAHEKASGAWRVDGAWILLEG